MSMLYTQEVFDRKTGEMILVDAGEWMTISELGERHGVGPRKAREVLRELDVVTMAGGGGTQRHHFAPWFLERDFGKRHPPTKARPYPFDVIGPMGREWIEERWADALNSVETKASSPVVSAAKAALHDFVVTRKRETMPIIEMVYWLCDHFPQLSQAEMGLVIGVSQPMVFRYTTLRDKQRTEAKARKRALLKEGNGKVAYFAWAEGAPSPARYERQL
ncbi:hypothetical protein [Labrys monachus]|uniref:Uncharacterized protein n=1 Tax=Labrys monachus TaxID=217067 RepID=A0ABU0FEA2_9HYPH|nr:hypothetical protein [Labrys monachus]MDQ0392642.1 hypothetical protein [Labrys monachus]